MQRSTAVVGGAIAACVLAALLLWSGAWLQFVDPGSYERTTVTVTDENGTELGAVDARMAQTWQQRLVGLSRTEPLAADEGMLFVHDREASHGYVMRDMAFPLDIVFVAENGTITAIHHAPVPAEGASEGALREYSGVGKYVLEVERGWVNETGVGVGDRVRIPGETSDGPAAGGDSETASRTTATTAADCETGPVGTPPDDETPTVTALGEDCTELATVSVAVADNDSERYTGLSDTESLADDEGMLFVFPESGDYAFVMREMAFPLDIIYIAENGTVTRIHHAPVPEGEYERRYPGEGKYVLEVNRGWANETGVTVGDRFRLPNVTASS
jgi:uncharacterized membrane protein (UPF0127 family)